MLTILTDDEASTKLNNNNKMPPIPTESAEVVLRKSTVKRIEDHHQHGQYQQQQQQQNGVNNVTFGTATKRIAKSIPNNDLSEVDTEQFKSDYENSFEPPTFTIKELRNAIPPELFEKNLIISSAYLGANIAVVAALFYVATFIGYFPSIFGYVLWPAWWWLQGVAMTGIWVIAHECGHQSFANSKTVNNAVGFVLHSALLVPYHPWRITHAQHHASTAHIGQDQVFVPKRRAEVRPADKEHSAWEEAWETSPMYAFGTVMIYLLFGWPAYLISHKSGQRYDTQTNHFNPSAPIFESRHRAQVLASDAGLAVMLAILGYLTYTTSFLTVITYYGIPYLWVNAWLVTITLLQHTDVYLPHYNEKSWNFVRGALTTVDRDYGWFLNHALHHIQDSHVAHHLFSQMPHYNAIKATPYLKEKLGDCYLYDRTPLWKALYRVARNCQFVEDTGDILFYRNK